MKTQTDSSKEQKNTGAPKVQQEVSTGGSATIEDNRSATVYQRKLQETMDASGNSKTNPIQRKANKTGLPDNLKSGIENLSGFAMDDVKVHYNSNKPAQLQAHAYAQGTDIHLASGQEKHLPHEAWHVVQQKQGRVKPTRQLKSKVTINDDTGLEKEADVMGAKALQEKRSGSHHLSTQGVEGNIMQRKGRTDALLQEFADYEEVCVFKLVFAGSGHDFIYEDGNREKKYTQGSYEDINVNLRRPKLSDFDEAQNGQPKLIKKTLEISGPGGPSTTSNKEYGYALKGLKDAGSNSTARMIDKVPSLVNTWFADVFNPNKKQKYIVLIKGHSRGAVAAHAVAHIIQQEHKYIHVELVSYDPVPGGAGVDNPKAEGNNALEGSTVIYSVASGAMGIFRPQRQMDADRVIITSRGHSANLGGNFIYEGELFKGSDLNSLPLGCFIETGIMNEREETNTKGKKKMDIEITHCQSIAEVKNAWKGYKTKNWEDSKRKKFVLEVASACIKRQTRRRNATHDYRDI